MVGLWFEGWLMWGMGLFCIGVVVWLIWSLVDVGDGVCLVTWELVCDLWTG